MIGLLVATAIVGGLGAAACSSGSGSPSPVGGVGTATGPTSSPDAAAPATAPAGISPSPSTAASSPGSETFRLTSTAFAEGGPIPRPFTCDGQDISPPLAWRDPPAGTVAYALIVDDPDAGGWVHWVVLDMAAGTSGLVPDASRTEASLQEGRTSWGGIGWRGPCPPSGTHSYLFTLAAVDRRLDLAGHPTASAVRAAMAGHLLGEAILTARYHH